MKLSHLPYLSVPTVLFVAACGGGGSSVITPVHTNPPVVASPTPKATSTPTAVAYSIKIRLVSGGTSEGTSARTRFKSNSHVTFFHVLNTGTHVLDDPTVNSEVPIEVAALPSPESALAQSGGDQGIAEVDVAPNPSAAPTISAIATGAPLTESPSTTNPNQFLIASGSSVPATDAFTADLTGSVTGSASIAIYQISQTLLACGNMQVPGTAGPGTSGGPQPYDQISALTFANGVATSVSTTSADVYFDGPNCTAVGFTNSSETEATLHFPYGATLVSSANTPFSELTASQYTNSFTSLTYTQFITDLTSSSPTPLNEILLQTASGSVVKIAPFRGYDSGNQDLVDLEFGYAQAGFSVDGFN